MGKYGLMNSIVDWYWEYGVKRGMDPADPEASCRRMSVAHWLDPVTRLVRRRETISKNANAKPCVAIWGPSQTGKSTLMSRYVDGDSKDGMDSALTWNPAHPVRFSPTQDWASIGGAYPNTLVFNPFNHGSDASGLATRYVLREDNDVSVNSDFPVEVKLSTDMQLLHALSIGYQEECRSIVASEGEASTYTPAIFGSLLESRSVEQPPVREAYEMLKDMADALEFMRGQERFNRLFINKGSEWQRILRPRLMDSRFVADKSAAEDFRSKVLWDGSARLNEFYMKVSALGSDLRKKWNGYKVVASPEVAALLLDIDTFRVFSSSDVADGHAQKVRDSVARLEWTIDTASNEVRLSVGALGSPEICGRNFGFFQALCAELIVPLKRSALQVAGKEAFLALLEKADLLDLPGLSNVNKGGSGEIDEAGGLDLTSANEVDIFKKVVKEGKTQSFVYNYANEYGVDAFLVLVRADRFPSKSSKLSSGIRMWQRAYDPEWTEGRLANHSMPVFLDMTFFASCVNNVAMNGVGNGLSPYVSRVQDELRFTEKETSKWFMTTYPQFPGGAVDRPEAKTAVVDEIMGDDVFVPRTGVSRATIEAVFEPDGGVGHMIAEIGRALDDSKRKIKCRAILADDWTELRRTILQHLPTDVEDGAEELRRSLREIGISIEEEMGRMEQRKSNRSYSELAVVLKNLLNVTPDILDAIPERAFYEELDGYVNRQIANWYANRVNGLEARDWFDLPHQQVLARAIRNVLENSTAMIADFIRHRLGQLDDQMACREGAYALAIAIENVIWTGTCDRKSDVVSVGDSSPQLLATLINGTATHSCKRDDSAHYHAVIKPFLDRLTEFENVVMCGSRPPQPGDNELKSLLDGMATA